MQLCNDNVTKDRNILRIEHQINRLRSMLADAWRCECPQWFIHRIENLLQHRWQKLEKMKYLLYRPMPA